MTGSYIDELKDLIRRLHGAEAEHVESVRVAQVFQDETVWEGVVEVFDLAGHPEARRAYAWSHDTDNPTNTKRHVAVLHLPPVKSAQDAVKALIIEDFRLARRNAREED